MNNIKSVCAALASSMVMLLASTDAVAASPESSDSWIQTKLVMTYVLNRHLSVFDIDTDVRDQVVYLKGTVETPIEKDLAEEIARSINEVKAVKSEIVVDRDKGLSARNSPRVTEERRFGQKINDITTTASIKSKVLANQNLAGRDVTVATLQGVVTLNGSVPSDVERALIAKIAENTDGVAKVENNLKIKKGA